MPPGLPRQPPTEDYTFDDVPAGASDDALRHFSIAHDEPRILPLLRQAKAINPGPLTPPPSARM
ncbi:hypothetical protein [Actinacidiphila sp. ITFR-21]|uniref:hypothetical protein n=1 Tax=Actinacidiphila sp. ITFR-21 TaxID=3075199 RepID=UPI00288B2B90|nr:hypothetical protein [Streptomyces sp. ITFR-21]WNI18033.1 hypothetical protein RLT57_22435 [Streptomyces sp. ITFR-21]